MKNKMKTISTSTARRAKIADARPWVKWYKTSAWKKLRAWQLRSEPLCREHKKNKEIVAADTVDHIKAHKGDMVLFFKRENLQSLCKSCHSSIKQRIEKSGEYGCDEAGFVAAWREDA